MKINVIKFTFLFIKKNRQTYFYECRIGSSKSNIKNDNFKLKLLPLHVYTK